jgi:hypothetical protein
MTAALALLSVVGTALALGAIAWGAWDVGITRLLVWLARYHARRLRTPRRPIPYDQRDSRMDTLHAIGAGLFLVVVAGLVVAILIRCGAVR